MSIKDVDSILVTAFGSHVYGTNLPTSDKDFKGVYLPTAEQILLQKIQPTIVRNTKADSSQKNTALDEDYEWFSLDHYLKLLLDGQTVCIDMLFTPANHHSHSGPVWAEIQANRHKLISKKAGAFVGYCRTQANKYGIKGSRVNAVREVVETFRLFNPDSRLWQYESHLDEIASKLEFISLDTKTELFECCGRKTPLGIKVKDALAVYEKVLDQYGQRALMAERNDGVDWKALMHAVRIANEAVELFQTGFVTQPRPEADLLLQIRKGELPYQEVAERIEGLLGEVEAASSTSGLPEKPDYAFAESLLLGVYGDVVRGSRIAIY